MNELGTVLQQYGNFAVILFLWVLMVVGTFDVTRKLVAFGSSRRHALYLSGYLVVSGLVGGFYYWGHRMELQLVAGLEIHNKQLPEDWAKGQPMKARQEGSKAYATAAFLGEGVLLKHLDASGAWVKFRPTEEDIAQRDASVTATTRLAEQSSSFLRMSLEWWLGCLIGGALGYFAGRGTTTAAANPTAEADARKSSARGSP